QGIEPHPKVFDAQASNRGSRTVSNGPTTTLPWPVQMLAVRSIRPAQRNARTHSKKQIREIADSMLRFGVINPLIVDDRGRIAAGHARAEAAKVLGLKEVPCIQLSHLSEAEIRAYMLADNKLAEKAGWDREILALELGDLQIALPEIGLDIGITGFDPGEIDSVMLDFSDDRVNPADQVPELKSETVVARKGDLFVLGRNRILVGDARDTRAFERLMQTETAE